MKNLMIQFVLMVSAALAAPCAAAQQVDASMTKLVNPSQSIAIHIGDLLHREIELELKPPYQISKNALPVKGLTRDGIELSEIKLNTVQRSEKTVYKISLSYQVFGHHATPSVMQLPAEKLAITGGSQALVINVPAWRFWFSPLVLSSIGNAKQNLQPQQPPPLVDIANHQTRLALYLVLLAIGLAGLVYINADKKWLPMMGGSFAQAYRQLKRLPKTLGDEKKALAYVHQAFNKVYGINLFAQDIDLFLAAHPAFSKLKLDIELFFDQSNKSLFAEQSHDSAALISDLLMLSKRLRDCERGV